MAELTHADIQTLFPTSGSGRITAEGLRTFADDIIDRLGSELEKITEDGKVGWRILGADPANYGDIGNSAVDLSISTSASDTKGATGEKAFTTGIDTTASGVGSQAGGLLTKADSDYSHAEGFLTKTVTVSSTSVDAIVASDAGSGDNFGNSVAITSTRIVIGADGDDDNGSGAGAVYSYALDGTDEIKMLGSNSVAGDKFGNAVDANDTKIIVGASLNEANGTWAGLAYIYDLDGTNEIILSSGDTSAYDFYGSSVAISENKIAVGAEGEGDPVQNQGAVYIYNLDGTGELKIRSSDIANGDYFGGSCALTDTHVAVTATGDDSDGAVYVYNIDGTNEVKITASDPENGGKFGSSIAINSTKVIVSNYDHDDSAGAVYIYDLDGTNEIKVVADDKHAWGYFGFEVTVTDTQIGVAAENADDSTGAIYLMDLNGTNQVKIVPEAVVQYDYFGTSIAISKIDGTVIAGADDTNGTLYVLSETSIDAIYSHAEGHGTIARNEAQHVQGKYNIPTLDTIHETGIGTDDTNRANAFEIYTDGRVHAPELTQALITDTRSLVTKEYVDEFKLEDLGDVAITDLQTNNIIGYNATSSKWENVSFLNGGTY